MAQGTRSTRRTLDAAEKHIVTITGLTEVEWESLQSNGVGDLDALSYLTFQDITGILRDPGQLGTANLLKAATEILDRVGVQKTDKVEVSAPNGIMLLPQKQVDDEEE